MFEIGKQVVCIAPNGPWPSHSTGTPYKGPDNGQILTVTAIKDYRPYGADTLGLQFFELQVMTEMGPGWFDCRWFRPVKDTNIDCFTEILTKVKNGELTDVRT